MGEASHLKTLAVGNSVYYFLTLFNNEKKREKKGLFNVKGVVVSDEPTGNYRPKLYRMF